MIRAVGTCSGRKSRSHIALPLRAFHDPNACPASPVTAKMLDNLISVTILLIRAQGGDGLDGGVLPGATKWSQAVKALVDDMFWIVNATGRPLELKNDWSGPESDSYGTMKSRIGSRSSWCKGPSKHVRFTTVRR